MFVLETLETKEKQGELSFVVCFQCGYVCWGFPSGISGKQPACQFGRCKRCRFNPWVGKIPGGGHGNPLQYSCLEHSMDRGAWWATVYGVAKSLAQLK